MWTAIASPPGPETNDPGNPDRLRDGAAKLRQRTDRAVIGLFGGNLLELGQFLYRNDNFFMLLAGEPEKAHAFLDALLEIHLGNLERFLGTVGSNIDVILFGDDLGMQSGPLISPGMYREFFKPRHAAMWRRAKELAPAQVIPVQITCSGMDPAGLKRDFGRDMVFWGGGCDTRDVLPNGSPAEVRAHVRKLLGVWKGSGGFVFQQVHNIMANVPPENITAMFDAVREFGAY